MSSPIDFSFLTDNCRPDNGQLRDVLEQLEALACAPFTLIDPNAGGCGQWGANGTITQASYDPVTREITIGGQEASTAYLLSALADVTFSPSVNITPVNTYIGASVNVAFNNPSACDQVLFVGNIYNTNVCQFGDDKIHRLELRDITAGAPGPLLGDLQMQFNGSSNSFILEEKVHTIPFFTIVPPSGSFNLTYRGEIVTSATSGGSQSRWFQNQIQVVAMGVPI